MNWNDITIGKFCEITKIKESDKWSRVKVAAIAKGMTFEEARNMPISQLSDIMLDFESLDFDKLPDKPKEKWGKYKIHLRMRDITSGQMIDYDELLQSCCEIRKVVDNIDKDKIVGKSIDKQWAESYNLGELVKDKNEPEEGEVKVVSDELITENLHNFMAVLTSKKGDNIETFEERAQYFYDKMPISIAWGAHVFFCKVAKKREICTKTFSQVVRENPIN